MIRLEKHIGEHHTWWSLDVQRRQDSLFHMMPPGTFIKGADSESWGATAGDHLQEVTLTRPFFMADSTCTQALWRALMHMNPSFTVGDQYPVTRVSYDMIQEFIQKLNRRVEEVTFRLPTEAEWEYVCKSGLEKNQIINLAANSHCLNINFDGTLDGIVRILPKSDGIQRASESGVYNRANMAHMQGNVHEWVSDWFNNSNRSLYMESTPLTDPTGPVKGSYRITKGGSFNSPLCDCRPASRTLFEPDTQKSDLGFRLVFEEKINA